jgi:hypothetical protein
MDLKIASSLLRYEKETGILYWLHENRAGFKKSALMHKAGDVAICRRKDGRGVIRINGKLYLSYRIAWLLHYGEMPNGEIDHKNGDSSDDRIENLRDCSRTFNQENLRNAFKNKESCELIGVYLDKRKKEGNKRWRSAITSNGKQISLGYFRTKDEAYAAYIAAKRVIHAGCTI